MLRQDWNRVWKQHYRPLALGRRLRVEPAWLQEPEAAGVLRIVIDPGMAFGTGTHPTTRMCLRWIAGQDLRQRRVLDYGCGSGILAIGAAKFGAQTIDAVDIDPDAVRATLDNAQANGVQLHSGLPDQAQGQYDVVLANILATPLKVLAPLLCARVAPGGHLVLAGILSRQADELRQAYAAHAELQVIDEEDGWVCMGAHMPT